MTFSPKQWNYYVYSSVIQNEIFVNQPFFYKIRIYFTQENKIEFYGLGISIATSI